MNKIYTEDKKFKRCPRCYKNLLIKKQYNMNKSKNLPQHYCKKCSNEIRIIWRRSKGVKKKIINRHPELVTNYFNKIDKKEKAYWLGFLYADGYISKDSRRITLTISLKDECIVDEFIKFVGANKSVKKYYGPYKTCGKTVTLTITNQSFTNNLVKHGCVNKKSKIIKFPKFDKISLNLAFLLGYYDGDGSEGEPVICSGSINFIKEIKKHYVIKNKIRNTSSGSCYLLCLGNDLFRKMIVNYDKGLKRKRYIRRSG